MAGSVRIAQANVNCGAGLWLISHKYGEMREDIRAWTRFQGQGSA